MSRRDAYILSALGVVGLFAAFWFLALGPKRDNLRKLDSRIQQSEQSLVEAKQEAQLFAKDRLEFPHTYATVVRLGKAAPDDPQMPSLLLQLEDAAADAGVDFRKLSLKSAAGGSSSSGTSTPAAPVPSPPSAPPGGATGQSGATAGAGSAQGGAQASGTTGGGGAAAGSSASASASAPPATAAANAQTTATTPIGTAVGPAQLPVLRLSLTFQGNFFKMADFIHNIRQLVAKQRKSLVVSGRLLTIDGIAFSQGDAGFPQIKAAIAATAYIVPESQGLLAGATPQGPGGAGAATPTPVSGPPATSPSPSAVVRLP